MKKFTFMIDGYENYEPSNYEHMYDEDRLWEVSYDVIASSKEEAMKKLLNGDRSKQREIIDEDRVRILRIFRNPENYNSDDECTEYTYLIVSTKDVRPGVDFVEENITIIEKSFTENKWCSDGIEKISTYLFNDGFSIKEINRSASGWSESETLLLNSNSYYTLYTRGEDTYNRGDKKIYACQSSRFKAIEKYKNEKNILARRYKASILNATKTSRQTFLDREMPYLVA